MTTERAPGDDANRNQLWARVLMEELARSGVQHVVVAPGSRSTALVLAAHAHSELEVHVCIDERSAGFFALGIGRASGRPAAVVTTSGTAVANLLPAAVEADRAEVPLLLVTADRPRELRDGDANQSVTQPGMFSSCARAEWDLMHPEISNDAIRHLRAIACRAVAAAEAPGGGPVHVNVPMRKPLEPTRVEADVAAIVALDPAVRAGRPERGGHRPRWTVVNRGALAAPPGLAKSVVAELSAADRPLIVVGHLQLAHFGHGGPSQLLAPIADLGIPILVDPLSGLRACAGLGATRVAAYDTLLRDDDLADRLRPDLILQLGRTPTSQALVRRMTEWGARRVVFADGPLYKDHTSTADAVLTVDPLALAMALEELGEESRAGIRDRIDTGWRGMWAAAEAAAAQELGSPTSAEAAVARAVVNHTPGGVPLFISSSMPIRDVDTVSAVTERDVRMFGNRGASGIDGIVSSALGVALGSVPHPEHGAQLSRGSERSRGVCLLGDLALIHDANGLALAGEADVVFVVVNNDGGGIFNMLPVAEFDPPFTELFSTPHGRDLAAHAAAFAVPHELVDAQGVGAALDRALAAGGTRVIEVRTDRATEVEARCADRTRAIEAARAALVSLGDRSD